MKNVFILKMCWNFVEEQKFDFPIEINFKKPRNLRKFLKYFATIDCRYSNSFILKDLTVMGLQTHRLAVWWWSSCENFGQQLIQIVNSKYYQLLCGSNHTGTGYVLILIDSRWIISALSIIKIQNAHPSETRSIFVQTFIHDIWSNYQRRNPNFYLIEGEF